MKHISDNCDDLKKEFICQPMGVTTGFAELDKAIWGFQPGQLITVGGRPSMGKTGLLLDMALPASKKVPVGIFSLEMPFNRLQARACANLADLNYRNIRAGDITEEQQQLFMDAAESLKTHRLHIDDAPAMLGIDDYWLKARKTSIDKTMDFKIKQMVQKKGCKVIFIDYLQLIAYTNASVKDRRIVVGNITEQLRDYAKIYGFCCVLLCQLRRFEQGRYGSKGSKKKDTEIQGPLPTLDDLKESGEIENHSDIVVLLHRPQYYNDHQEINLTTNIIEGDALLMLRKNRDGPKGNIPVEYHSFSMSYRDFKKTEREF